MPRLRLIYLGSSLLIPFYHRRALFAYIAIKILLSVFCMLRDVRRFRVSFLVVTRPRVVTHSITSTSCLLHRIPTATDPNSPLLSYRKQRTSPPHAMNLPSCCTKQNITMARLFSLSPLAHQTQTTSRLHRSIHRFWPLVEQNITSPHLSD
jgi:hypothetical protein